MESRNVSLSLWRTCKKSSSVSLGSMSMMSMTLQGSHDSLTDLISPPVYMSVVATIALLCTAHWVYRVILSWLVRFRNSWVYTHQGPGTLRGEIIFSDTFNLNTIFLPDRYLARRSTYCQIILCNEWFEWGGIKVQGRSSHSRCHPAWEGCCE